MWGPCAFQHEDSTFWKDQTGSPKIYGKMLHGIGIFTYIYHKFMVNVGKYSSPMEHLGMVKKIEGFPTPPK